MQSLLEEADYEVIESTDNPDASREELVEILANNITPSKKIAQEAEAQASNIVYMIDDDENETAEFEEYYLEEDYDGMVSEEYSDEQYLDEDYEGGDSLMVNAKLTHFYQEIFQKCIYLFAVRGKYEY